MPRKPNTDKPRDIDTIGTITLGTIGSSLDPELGIRGPSTSAGGSGVSDRAFDIVGRKKLARERERVRSRERYQEQRAERLAASDYRGPGRPATGTREMLKPIMVGESMHKKVRALAASRMYKAEFGNRIVSMRELVEEALTLQFPEMGAEAGVPDSAEEIAAREAARDAEIMSDIVMRATAGPEDYAHNWGAPGGDKVAVEYSPSGRPTVDYKGNPIPPLTLSVKDLALFLFGKLRLGEDIGHIATLQDLVKDYQR